MSTSHRPRVLRLSITSLETAPRHRKQQGLDAEGGRDPGLK